ncbi:PREDICTED: uncharacterized protein LOC105991448 [Dipodomys ordii]|uniref:Uncharacterized protein LOC105991448 n=1 Tax=Dipodomys ordii TaxID=10020 RepID=A0A1S3FU44_DIPOR|nr:PREDICTED: uncharacterized protein LOC105991448 [Dipodomys ordii]
MTSFRNAASPVPPASLTPAHKPSAKPARELPAKAQARQPQRRAGLGGRGPCALRPPAPLAPAHCLLSGGACRIGSPKLVVGGNRRKVAQARSLSISLSLSLRPGGAEEGALAPGVPHARQPVRVRAGPDRGHDSQRLRGAPQEAPSYSTAGATTAVAEAAPQRGAMPREDLRGSPSPREAARHSPYLSLGADTSRAPSLGVRDRKITAEAGLQEGGFRTRELSHYHKVICKRAAPSGCETSRGYKVSIEGSTRDGGPGIPRHLSVYSAIIAEDKQKIVEGRQTGIIGYTQM